VSATIIASIAIFAAGKGQVSYIDALLFASGANTQAGLNPVDVNNLNLFQQIVMYIFPMLSNPITLHGSVVLLRLYWFEKRFQGLVRDVRQRRTTLSKSRSKARGDVLQAEEGVNGRNITVVPPSSQNSPRVANDGILLSNPEKSSTKPGGMTDSDTVVTDERHDSIEMTNWERSGADSCAVDDSDDDRETSTKVYTGPQTAISFANTVKRSDGVDDDPTNFAHGRNNADHIAILERQRNQDNEVLRIPGPRDAERGLGPRRLNEDETQDDDDPLYRAVTREPAAEGVTRTARAITITEPDRPKRDEIQQEVADGAKAFGSTLDSLRFRKPRVFNRRQDKVHEDAETRSNIPTRTKTLETIRSALSREKVDDMPYLSYTPTMGRNSNFVGLTLEQREELGGIEYRSLRTLLMVLLGYFWGFQLLGLTFLLPFIIHDKFYGPIVDAAGVTRPWWGFWTANVAFMDVGFTLTPDSMNSFHTSEYALMVMWFFIIIGNTGFPVMLRFIIWVLSKITPRGSGLWEELRFLLDHPRRCFTLLFPSGATWWLFWILVILNVVDLIFYIVLDVSIRATFIALV
jgi:potassium uptake Trk family protein